MVENDSFLAVGGYIVFISLVCLLCTDMLCVVLRRRCLLKAVFRLYFAKRQAGDE